MTKREACKATEHAFDKFDEATIYCRNCGEQRVMDLQAVIALLPKTTYLPCPGPHYPVLPTWQPWWGTGDGTVPQPVITYGRVTVGNTVQFPAGAQISDTIKENA